MRERVRSPIALILLVLSLCCSAAGAESEHNANRPVALELVLAVDISASVNDGEFRLQMDGLARAFQDPDVIASIESQRPDGIAVTLVLWSARPRQTIGWTQIRDRASAYRFAREIATAPRTAVGRTTAIGSAIRYATSLFPNNGFTGRRRAIDVSGDGRNNSGHPIWLERRAALAAGVTINGLAILDGDPKLESYFEGYVAGGPGAFVLTAGDFADFARAIRLKLLREINPAVVWRAPRPDYARPAPTITHTPHAALDPRELLTAR